MKKHFRSILSGILAVFMMLSTVSGNVTFAHAKEPENVFAVKEDAYLRSDKANTNYNYEEIGKAHGAQYVGQGIKTISARAQNIIGMMKFDLPSIEEISEQEWNHFELELNVFKNPSFNDSDQIYHVNYSLDTSWDETNVTWNNRPEDVTVNSGHILGTFDVQKGYEFEGRPASERNIRVDISEGLLDLIKEGHQEITIYLTGEKSTSTSLMTYAKETSDQSMIAKIHASSQYYSKEDLKVLIDQCELLNEVDYTEDSFKELNEKLQIANDIFSQTDATKTAITEAYLELKDAFSALISVLDPGDPENVAFRKPSRSNLAKQDTEKVNDGDISTSWVGKFYPSYVDIDLMDTYDISGIYLNFPKDKTVYYTVYGSNDGEHYDEIY